MAWGGVLGFQGAETAKGGWESKKEAEWGLMAFRLLQATVVSANNSRTCRTRVLFSSIFVLLTSLSATASVARYVPFEEKVERAGAIVLGRCTATTSELDPSGRWIVTRARFAVAKNFKGSPAPEVEVVMPGGRVGTLHQQAVGIPSFSVGDERLIFVGDSAAGPSVLYFDQGTYRVERDSSGTAFVEPVTSHLVLVDPQTGKAIPQGEPRRSLAEFERDVRSALDRSRPRPVEAGTARPQPGESKPNGPAGVISQLSEHAAFILLAAVGMLLALVPLLRRG